MPRPLRVFLCHSSKDKSAVRELYKKLRAETWIDPWLDEEKLFPGQDWHEEIEKAVEATDVVVVLLSKQSVSQEGYVQRELKLALDVADEKPENTIFIIPLRLDDCPAPRRLRGWHYVDYFPANRKDWVLERLIASLKLRAKALGIENSDHDAENRKSGDAEHMVKENSQREAAEKVAREKLESARKAELEKAKHEVEREAKRKKQREFITANSRWLGIGGIILIALVFGGFGGNYLLNNLPAIETSTVASSITSESPISTATEPRAPTATKNPATATFTSTPPTPTLGIGSTMISEKDGMVLVYVPAGEFTMGSNDGSSDEQPVHQVYLDAFWIDQTEVTNAMYVECVADGDCLPPASTRSYTHDSYYVNPDFDNYPVIYVNWNKANTYCKWARRELPTEAEWEKAARGLGALSYPWGEGVDCNNANYKTSCVGDTTQVGNYPDSASVYGVFDLSGNVWEWTSSLFKPYPYIFVDGREDMNSTGNRVIRGGAWDDWWYSALSTYRSDFRPYSESIDIGFRCSRSP